MLQNNQHPSTPQRPPQAATPFAAPPPVVREASVARPRIDMQTLANWQAADHEAFFMDRFTTMFAPPGPNSD
jgi:hypothetical protein